MSFKTTDGLMRHLRDNGIDISGSVQKRQLINTGYFHGYKGYRFFRTASNPIKFNSFNEVYATIKYDSNLKALFYSKIMYIETAVKNTALNRIMIEANSEHINNMFSKVIASYNSFPVGTDEKTRKKAQTHKLMLETNVHAALSNSYKKDNPQITHFYNRDGYSGVPLWALFEILTLGEFANLLSCLNFNTREKITLDLGMQVASIDTNRELIYKYLYILKDLRNAVAHNAVVFDTRFRKFDPSKAMKKCLQQEFNLAAPVSFKNIDDYLILICYYLKLLKVSKKEIRSFINEFEKITNAYTKEVSSGVSAKVINPNIKIILQNLKNSL